MLELTFYGLAVALIVVFDVAYGDDMPVAPEKLRPGRITEGAFNHSPLTRAGNTGLRRISGEHDDAKVPLLQVASLTQTCAVSSASDLSPEDAIHGQARDV